MKSFSLQSSLLYRFPKVIQFSLMTFFYFHFKERVLVLVDWQN